MNRPLTEPENTPVHEGCRDIRLLMTGASGVVGWTLCGQLATDDLVLSLDAGDRVTPELRDAIQQTMATPWEHVAFRVPRLSSYTDYVNRTVWIRNNYL